ncbi:MAG: ABC transporter substrate-binding protein [Arsenicicoccus sp.]|nr:MAG: ABC transporter substrate-binding protein [Arsenicicoccus sp.]
MDAMRSTAILLSAVGLSLCGCGLSIPSDPDGTLQRVTGGELRVGVSPNPPWTVLPPSEGEPPTGRSLEQDELDLVIGGLTEKSPWTTHAALTVPHSTSMGPEGDPVGRVLAVPMGENAFMVTVEKVLVERGGRGG